jgi:hypothetical protein
LLRAQRTHPVHGAISISANLMISCSNPLAWATTLTILSRFPSGCGLECIAKIMSVSCSALPPAGTPGRLKYFFAPKLTKKKICRIDQ